MSDRQLRIGDADREQAAAALGEHFAQGRLTLDEHTERLDQIWSARTHGDLEPVFRDLPGKPARPVRPTPFGSARRGFRFPFFPVIAILVILTIVTHVPVILFGLVLFWFVAARRHRWHART